MAQDNVNDILGVKDSKGENYTPTPTFQSSGTVVNSANTQINKVVNVTLDGGIIGLLSNSPQRALNDKIKAENAKGWKVIQVIPADSGNLFLSIFRLLLLFCTFLMYTTANGYYLIMEKTQTDVQFDDDDLSDDELTCSNCGKEYPASMIGSFCQECGTKL